MLFDARLRPSYYWLQMGELAVWGRLIYIMNTPTDDMNLQYNQGFMTVLKSYSVKTIFVTAVNVLNLWKLE